MSHQENFGAHAEPDGAASAHEGWEVGIISPSLRSMSIVTAGGCTNRTQRCAEELTW